MHFCYSNEKANLGANVAKYIQPKDLYLGYIRALTIGQNKRYTNQDDIDCK